MARKGEVLEGETIRPRSRRRREGLCLGVALLLFLTLGGGMSGSVQGAEVEVIREIRYSEDFGEQVRTALAEMLQDLARVGCLSGQAYAHSKEADPRVLVLVVSCLESGGQAKR